MLSGTSLLQMATLQPGTWGGDRACPRPGLPEVAPSRPRIRASCSQTV